MPCCRPVKRWMACADEAFFQLALRASSWRAIIAFYRRLHPRSPRLLPRPGSCSPPIPPQRYANGRDYQRQAEAAEEPSYFRLNEDIKTAEADQQNQHGHGWRAHSIPPKRGAPRPVARAALRGQRLQPSFASMLRAQIRSNLDRIQSHQRAWVSVACCSHGGSWMSKAPLWRGVGLYPCHEANPGGEPLAFRPKSLQQHGLKAS
jgi:hypothetical protein